MNTEVTIKPDSKAKIWWLKFKRNLHKIWHIIRHPDNDSYEELPMYSKVKIINTYGTGKYGEKFYKNNIGQIIDYWRGNQYGEYNVILIDGEYRGCNDCFDAWQLEYIGSCDKDYSKLLHDDIVKDLKK